MMLKKMLTGVACLSIAAVCAGEITWIANKGNAATAPTVTAVDVDGIGKIYRGEVVADGAYQSMSVKFSEPVDLQKYSGVEFYVSHNISKVRIGLVVRLEQKPVNAYTTAVVETPDRTKVYVPFDAGKFNSTDGKTATFGKVHEICIYPYGEWNQKGEFFEFDNFRFVPKSEVAK